MYISELKILNFRNYEILKLRLKKNINILIGDNGQGKTNLLESIYVLGLTKSHRSFIDNNLIKKNEKNCIIKGILNKDTIKTNLEIDMENKKKILKIDNNIMKKSSDYISKMNIIIFYPEDLELIKGSPITRRRFLNLELSQLNSNYFVILNDYNKLLKMRNDYLKNNYIDINYLNILTNYLIEKAIIIYKIREKFINKLNDNIENIFYNITNLKNFNIKYKTSIEIKNLTRDEIKQSLREKFDEVKDQEIKFKNTLIGPHRDDFEFYVGDLNLKNYGSQGQQRLAIISLKLGEIDIFKKYVGTNPILLLDDVFSELDENKKNNLLKYINKDNQVIITTTDLNNIDKKILNNAKIIKIKNGKILKKEM
ncbi:MAG: DNA replication/repair protein RecF [Bacilli bacterium]|nr:DNA replication/repair protein RecF [Bacilli bacterium]